MKAKISFVLVLLSVSICFGLTHKISSGKPALNFTLQDTSGQNVTLGDYFGKVIVLEWRDPDCSYVKKQYNSNKMQELQKKYTQDYGVIWLTLLVGREKDEEKLFSTKELLDPSREVAKLYGITRVPQIVVIDASGYVAYIGAVDSIRSSLVEDVARAKVNYIANSLDAIIASYPVSVSHTRPYGCDISKYSPRPFERVA